VNEPCGNECVNERVCVYNTDESSAYKKHKSEVSTLSATGSILISEFPSSLVMFPWLLHVLQRRLGLLQSLYQHRAGDPQIGSQNLSSWYVHDSGHDHMSMTFSFVICTSLTNSVHNLCVYIHVDILTYIYIHTYMMMCIYTYTMTFEFVICT